MPDHLPNQRGLPPKWFLKGVRSDWIDKRDLFYAPSLSTLRSTLRPSESAIDFKDLKRPIFGLRDQGDSGRCVGHALANLIDIQRIGQAGEQIGQADRVSADMLYHMARFHDKFKAGVETPVPMSADLTEGVRSLRAAIKGFYHHGVCRDHAVIEDGRPEHIPEDRWWSIGAHPPPLEEPGFPSVAQAQAAREIGLGAYYRLRPILNHYHAALNDAGTVLISANVTHGWGNLTDEGVIPHGDDYPMTGLAHAVVIVGYDRRGFLILNSWGASWGGYEGVPGLALWTYKDWAENIIDGWVLRLGVSAPDAFDLTIGEQGTSRIYGVTQAGSVPCQELLGHYVHLDDGHHVELGAYPSSDDLMQKTYEFLQDRLRPGCCPDRHFYQGVVLWLPGSLEGMKEGFAAAVRRKKWFQDNGLFPITAFWCNDFVEHSMDVLSRIFEDAVAEAGDDAPHLDQLIEDRARGIGRAFWRDIEHAAQRSVLGITDHPGRGDVPAEAGHIGKMIDQLVAIAKASGTAIHIVAEGAGALVLAEWLEAAPVQATRRSPEVSATDRQFSRLRAKAEAITSLSLVLPAIDVPRARRNLLALVAMLNRDADALRQRRDVELTGAAVVEKPAARADHWQGALPPPARIFVPSPDLEKRLCMGVYGKSILHLVANAFEDRRRLKIGNEPRMMLGMARSICAVGEAAGAERSCDEAQCRCGGQSETQVPDALRLAFSPLVVPHDSDFRVGRIDQRSLLADPDLEAAIKAGILCRSDRGKEKQS